MTGTFPLFLVVSMQGITKNRIDGRYVLPDGYGVPAIAVGTEFGIPIFSSSEKAREYIAQQSLENAGIQPISDVGELRDVVSRFRDNYSFFALDVDDSDGWIRRLNFGQLD